MIRLALCAVLSLLAACAGSPKPPPIQTVTIPDVTPYLAQTICADGVLEIVETGCPGARQQRASDPMLMRRYDWGAPAGQPGFMAQDGFVSDDGQTYINTWAALISSAGHRWWGLCLSGRSPSMLDDQPTEREAHREGGDDV